jgi:hypothetical protein
MWAAHEVEVRGPMLKRVSHPQAGPLEFECLVLHIAETGQRLIAYCPDPGSAIEVAFTEFAAQAMPGLQWRPGDVGAARRDVEQARSR